MRESRWLVHAGDAAALAFVTISGFATHGETDLIFLPRFLAIYIPLVLAWFLFGGWLKLSQPETFSNPRQLWRVPLAMLFAVPLAVVVRSYLLQADIILIFIPALGATSTLGIVLWRVVFYFMIRS